MLDALLSSKRGLSIELPATALRKRTAFRQISLTPLGRSGALLIGTISADEKDFTMTVTAATSRPVQLTFAAIPQCDTLRELIEDSIPDCNYYNDVHGAPQWRKRVTLLLAEEIRRELSEESAA